jgi:hypothetical protein
MGKLAPNRKDYSSLIGQTFGELTILSIGEPLHDGSHSRNCYCRCSCGVELTRNFFHVKAGRVKSCGHLRSEKAKVHAKEMGLRGAKKIRNVTAKAQSNNQSGIRNVYWIESEGRYVVSIKRNGKMFRARSSTLEGAIAKKEELLKKVELYLEQLKTADKTQDHDI